MPFDVPPYNLDGTLPDSTSPDWRKTAYELQRRIDELEEACMEAVGYIEAGESQRSYRILRRAIGSTSDGGEDV